MQFLVLLADFKLSAIFPKGTPNLQVFYGVGIAEFMEGVGSACYHICPQKFFFQFDVAMMLV